jgi:predicted branched-subunit amino acid permease
MPQEQDEKTNYVYQFGSTKRAVLGGANAAFGMPILALGASYLGLGSLVRDMDLSIWFGVFSTFTIWALPGQLAMIELYGTGASILVITLTVSLVNARFLPMMVNVMPVIRSPGVATWKYYLSAHLLSINSWAYLVQRGPLMPRDERFPYYIGFALTIWFAGMICAALGFHLAGVVPRPVSLGLVFLNPIYFMLLIILGIKKPAIAFATCIGAVLGPLLHLVSPDWGLMATGVIAGSFGFFLGRFWERYQQKNGGAPHA